MDYMAVWQCGSVIVWQCESVMWAQVQTIWEAFARTSLAHTLRLQIKDTLHKTVVRKDNEHMGWSECCLYHTVIVLWNDTFWIYTIQEA